VRLPHLDRPMREFFIRCAFYPRSVMRPLLHSRSHGDRGYSTLEAA
jgi:hypothetical protein